MNVDFEDSNKPRAVNTIIKIKPLTNRHSKYGCLYLMDNLFPPAEKTGQFLTIDPQTDGCLWLKEKILWREIKNLK